MSVKMIITICENGHKVKNFGSINKTSEKGKKTEIKPQVSKTCPRCFSKIVEKIEIE